MEEKTTNGTAVERNGGAVEQNGSAVERNGGAVEKSGNGITEMVFIIDRSGSMCGMEADTVGGFNAMIEKQKKLDGKCYVSTVLFANTASVLHDRVEIQKIEPMTKQQYVVGGCTALLDAIGGAIHHIGNIHKYAGAEDVPEHTIFVITTDGMENASREYDSATVKSMIQRQEERFGWEFLFVAANIDAVETAARIGIRADRAADYTQTEAGTRSVYDAVDFAVCSMRRSVPLREEWKGKLNHQRRGKK